MQLHQRGPDYLHRVQGGDQINDCRVYTTDADDDLILDDSGTARAQPLT